MGKITRLIRPVDISTGEIIEGAFSITQPIRPPAALHKGGYVMISQEQAITQKIADAKLTASDWRVLWILLAMIDFENWLHVDQTHIGNKLNMLPRHVNRSIGRLVDQGILARGPKVGRFGTLRLDPRIAWKGKPHNYQAAIIEFDKARPPKQARTAPDAPNGQG